MLQGELFLEVLLEVFYTSPDSIASMMGRIEACYPNCLELIYNPWKEFIPHNAILLGMTVVSPSQHNQISAGLVYFAIQLRNAVGQHKLVQFQHIQLSQYRTLYRAYEILSRAQGVWPDYFATLKRIMGRPM